MISIAAKHKSVRQNTNQVGRTRLLGFNLDFPKGSKELHLLDDRFADLRLVDLLAELVAELACQLGHELLSVGLQLVLVDSGEGPHQSTSVVTLNMESGDRQRLQLFHMDSVFLLVDEHSHLEAGLFCLEEDGSISDAVPIVQGCVGIELAFRLRNSKLTLDLVAVVALWQHPEVRLAADLAKVVHLAVVQVDLSPSAQLDRHELSHLVVLHVTDKFALQCVEQTVHHLVAGLRALMSVTRLLSHRILCPKEKELFLAGSSFDRFSLPLEIFLLSAHGTFPLRP